MYTLFREKDQSSVSSQDLVPYDRLASPAMCSQSSNPYIQDSSFIDAGGDPNINVLTNHPGSLPLLRAASLGFAFDSPERPSPARCHPGTRVAILNDIEKWIGDTKGTKILWLHGPPGVGKSAIAQTVAETCSARAQLAASFFFSRSDHSRNTSKHFFPTLALQLALSIPKNRKQVFQAVQDDATLLHQPHSAQLMRLIVRPLLSSRSKLRREPFVVVVDALDECGDNGEQLELLSHFRQLTETHTLPLRFLVTSRSGPHIHTFSTTISLKITSFSLDTGNDAYQDVALFLRSSFRGLCDSARHGASMESVSKPWPSDEETRCLAKRSGGLFVYARTVLRYLEAGYSSPVERLQQVLGASPTSPTSPSSPFATGLDSLYLQILSICHPPPHTLSNIMGVLLLLPPQFCGPSAIYDKIDNVEAILNLRSGQVLSTLRGLHSVLDFNQGHKDGVVRVMPLHRSFVDFLFDKSRAAEYHIDRKEINADMVRRTAGFIRNFKNEKSTLDLTLLCQLLPNLTEHLVNAVGSTSQDALLHQLAESARDWGPCILASGLWNSDNRIALLRMLSSVRRYFKLLRPHPPADLIHQFTELLDLAFRSHISSPTCSAMLKAILILAREDVIMSSIENMEELLRISGFPVGHGEEEFRRYAMALLDSSTPDLHGVRGDLWEFLDNPKRCGDLIHDQAKCYTRIVKHWLLFLENPSVDRNYRFWHDTFDPRWSQFLRHCVPGDEDLIDRLRVFNPDMASKTDTRRIMDWLQDAKKPPRDVLRQWQAYAVEKWGPQEKHVLPTMHEVNKAIDFMMTGALNKWMLLFIVCWLLLGVHDKEQRITSYPAGAAYCDAMTDIPCKLTLPPPAVCRESFCRIPFGT